MDQICLAILRFIETHGRRVTLSQLRRGLNASRYHGTFDAAVRQLQDLGAITIEKEPGTRRRWVTLVEAPKRVQGHQTPAQTPAAQAPKPRTVHRGSSRS